jgi:hypothetical protein
MEWNHYLQGEEGCQKVAKRIVIQLHKVRRGDEVVLEDKK